MFEVILRTNEPKIHTLQLNVLPRKGEHIMLEDGTTIKVTFVVHSQYSKTIGLYGLVENLNLPL